MDIYDEDYFSIKPDNFLIGIEKDSTKVGMKDQWIDFCFSFIEKTFSISEWII